MKFNGGRDKTGIIDWIKDHTEYDWIDLSVPDNEELWLHVTIIIIYRFYQANVLIYLNYDHLGVFLKANLFYLCSSIFS